MVIIRLLINNVNMLKQHIILNNRVHISSHFYKNDILMVAQVI